MPKAASPDPAVRFHALSELLELEAKAAAVRSQADLARLSAADAERLGLSLLDLVLIDEAPSPGGLFELTLRKRNRTLRLPWSRHAPGDPIVLRDERAPDVLVRGVVLRRHADEIRVAVAAEAELDDEQKLRLDRSSDEVTVARERQALARLASLSKGRSYELVSVMEGLRAASFGPTPEPEPSGLDASQEAAVGFALAADDVALIHGPPGTGKTRTVCELIRRAVLRGEKVLATAPSNMAVDNMAERLIRAGLSVVRIGHPARVLPELVEHTLALQVEAHEDLRLARNLVKEAFQLRRQADKWTRKTPERGSRAELKEEARARFRDARRLEARASETVLDRADVILGTLGMDPEILGARRFDRVVIDEAGQSTEPASWLPLLRAERVVLAGDHQQLPPTVISPEAAARGFGVSLFERLIDRDGERIGRRLGVQYRMNAAIMGFSAEEHYAGGIIADASVASHVLADLPGVARDEWTTTPFLFLDTAGAGHGEVLEPDGESRRNPGEAELIVSLVERLRSAGVAAGDIGVITPYAAQARLLETQLARPELEVDTVDGFQGREKEVILISFVRSNDEGEIGFLADLRRTNVALTRARRKLICVGDSATLGGHAYYARLIAYAESLGAYRTVWEL